MVDPARMRANLDATHGLIMSEAVMMGLAPHLGREAAHHVVKLACDLALAERIPLAQALAREPTLSARLDNAAIARLTDPANYLGATQEYISRIIAVGRAIS